MRTRSLVACMPSALRKMEAVGRLSGGIAHDFNNLQGVIIGYSQLLKRALGADSHLAEHVNEIEKAGDRAAALTRQLLAFSRQQILTPTVLNLNDLVADMQKMLPRLIGEDITVTMGMEPTLESVRADRNQIEQVIMNLAVNSRDAMPAGGELRIDTKNVYLDEVYTRMHPGAKIRQYVCLWVTDSGEGWMRRHWRTFLSHFSPPRKWARAPDWDLRRCTES